MTPQIGGDSPRGAWVLLVVIVLSSSCLLARGLSSPYITLFDEAVQLNVVQNLITDCCTPRLHRRDLGTDYRDWTDNYVWVHKPPIPFFINAAMASAAPRSVLALRFPALLFAEAIVVLVFILGIRFFDRWSAVVGAAGFAFNHYTFELVQGRQFSGMPDLTLAFWVLCALYFLLRIVESERTRHFVAFGACSGLAFLCKDGLALIPFAALAAVVVKLGWRTHARAFVYAALTTLLIAAASTASLAWLFPVEIRYEQQRRLAHLFDNVEAWSRPADYYFTIYFMMVTSPLIAGIGYVCVAWGVLRGRTHAAAGVLAVWVTSYLVALTPAVSKIPNFIYPAVPVLYLLMAVAAVSLWRAGRLDRILAASVTVLLTALMLQFNLFNSATWVGHFRSLSMSRFALPVFQFAVFGVSLAVLRTWGRTAGRRVAATGLSAAVAVILVASVRANAAAPALRPPDYDRQMALRQAALALPRELQQQDDIVLVEWNGVRKCHLYVMFWAGVESLEVNRQRPLDTQVAQAERVPAVYFLTDSPEPRYARPLRVGPGYLYRIR